MNIKLIEKTRTFGCREFAIRDHGVSGFKIRSNYRLAIPILFWVLFYRIANSYTQGRRISNSPEREEPERSEDDIGLTDEEILDRI